MRLDRFFLNAEPGNVGREVVRLLLEDGEQVVALTRNPATAALPNSAQVVGGDPSHPQQLSKALRGVKAVLVSPRALGAATAGAATAELLKLAAEQGAGGRAGEPPQDQPGTSFQSGERS